MRSKLLDPSFFSLYITYVLSKGLVEIFTGDGKGKTSAALGIALRALGQGLKILIVYFMKGASPLSEMEVLSQNPDVTILRSGEKNFVNPKAIVQADKDEAQKALNFTRQAMLSKKYDIIILDEINVASAWGLIDLNEVQELIKSKPEKIELILTGRYADDSLIALADLVTHMTKVKHPYDQGILARKGIDY